LVKWQDEDAFFSDYAASHKKLSELGFTPPSSSLKAITKNRTLLAQSAVGVAVAATVIILSYFYEINRRV
jgi:L-ascorbate peroxidase